MKLVAERLGIHPNLVYKKTKEDPIIRYKNLKDKIKEYQDKHPGAGSRPAVDEFNIARKTARRYRLLAGVKAKIKASKPKSGPKEEPETKPHPNKLIESASERVHGKPHKGFYFKQSILDSLNVWLQDFSFIKTESGFIYLALVVDLCSRFIISWNIMTHHRASLVNKTFQEALDKYLPPDMTHTDQGSEYLSKSHQQILTSYNILHSCSEAGKPWQNGFIERIFRTLKLELPSTYNFNFIEVFELVNAVIYYYNHQRKHSVLKTTPFNYFQTNKLTAPPTTIIIPNQPISNTPKITVL